MAWECEVIYDLCIAGLERKLLFSTGVYLKDIDLNSGEVRVLMNSGSLTYSLTYDYNERYMYVPRSQGDIIRYLIMFQIICK